MRDELEQLLDDDDDMVDLYLSRKLCSASPLSNSGGANWFPTSPTMDLKISRASRASMATGRGEENDVEDLEMLLEFMNLFHLEPYFYRLDCSSGNTSTTQKTISTFSWTTIETS